jgi:hypothetical protein
MGLETIGSVVGIASGLNSIFGGGGSTSKSAKSAQTAVDPFASYRGKLASMYSNMLQAGDKTDITKMPGYSQFQTGVMDPALEASKRSSAASGMLRSGNEQISLEKTAQQGYSGFMTDYMNRLATGSGAGYAPTQGGMSGIAQGNLNQQAQMQGIGGVLTGVNQLYGGTNSVGGSPGWSNIPWGGGAGVDSSAVGYNPALMNY